MFWPYQAGQDYNIFICFLKRIDYFSLVPVTNFKKFDITTTLCTTNSIQTSLFSSFYFY